MPTSADLYTRDSMLNLTDKIGLIYQAAISSIGTSTDYTSSNYLSEMAGQLHDLVIGSGYRGVNSLSNKAQIDSLSSVSETIRDFFLAQNLISSQFGAFIEAMTNHCSRYGRYVSTSITDLDSFASYWNAATAWYMQYSWQFATVYYLWTGTAQMLSATNVIGPPTVLGRGTVTGVDTATYTVMATVGTTNNVTTGVQGYSPDQIEIVFTGGTFTGTVVATGVNQAGESGHTWTTGGLTGKTSASSPVVLTPTVANERTTNITGISYVGANTGATFNIRTLGRAVS